MNNMEETKRPVTKAKRERTRRACDNCRNSHVHCDEARPKCGRCSLISAKRECECIYPGTERDNELIKRRRMAKMRAQLSSSAAAADREERERAYMKNVPTENENGPIGVATMPLPSRWLGGDYNAYIHALLFQTQQQQSALRDLYAGSLAFPSPGATPPSGGTLPFSAGLPFLPAGAGLPLGPHDTSLGLQSWLAQQLLSQQGASVPQRSPVSATTGFMTPSSGSSRPEVNHTTDFEPPQSTYALKKSGETLTSTSTNPTSVSAMGSNSGSGQSRDPAGSSSDDTSRKHRPIKAEQGSTERKAHGVAAMRPQSLHGSGVGQLPGASVPPNIQPFPSVQESSLLSHNSMPFNLQMLQQSYQGMQQAQETQQMAQLQRLQQMQQLQQLHQLQQFQQLQELHRFQQLQELHRFQQLQQLQNTPQFQAQHQALPSGLNARLQAEEILAATAGAGNAVSGDEPNPAAVVMGQPRSDLIAKDVPDVSGNTSEGHKDG